MAAFGTLSTPLDVPDFGKQAAPTNLEAVAIAVPPGPEASAPRLSRRLGLCLASVVIVASFGFGANY
jgi:hypothetical protein